MKKTFNINIAGCPFVIDEDAYEMLDSYLKTLSQICSKAGQPETAADIEVRIAEIFSENNPEDYPKILTLADVQEVIDRMGAPEEIVDVDISQEKPSPTPPPFIPSHPIRKRLYRDVDHRVLGGVCSGIAWYLGIDVVWVRIAMVLLTFLSASTVVIIYIVLWMIIPAARSPFERMQMMGVNPSMGNVGRVVTGTYDAASPYQNEPPVYGESSSSNRVGRVLIMILSVLGLLVVGSLLLSFALAFIGCLIVVCLSPSCFGQETYVQVKLILGCVMGGCLVVGVPLALLFRRLIASLTDRNIPRLNFAQRLCMVLTWLLGVAACIVCGILLGHL